MNAGFFTRSYRVPHPRLDPRGIAAIHLALLRAFELLRADGFDGGVGNFERAQFLNAEVILGVADYAPLG